MEKHYCDLCEVEIPAIHGVNKFPDYVCTSGCGDNYIKVQFDVCGDCTEIWNDCIKMAIQELKDQIALRKKSSSSKRGIVNI